MKYVDYFFASTILMVAVLFMLVTEISHPRGAILDVPFLWLLVAMLNFLRLRNEYRLVSGLKNYMHWNKSDRPDPRDCASKVVREFCPAKLGSVRCHRNSCDFG